MNRSLGANVVLGACVIVFALVLVLVWIPLDTHSGWIDVVRRRMVIGDRLAPTVAGVFLLLGGVLVAVAERRAPKQSAYDPAALRFVLSIAALLAAGLLIMTYAGTAAVALYNAVAGTDLTYRPLRASVPWKYIGFFLGCSFAVAGISALTERRLGLRHVVIGVGAALLLILFYDAPFEDVLLPPNGDLS